MRISDWSSDVCSSDLLVGFVDFLEARLGGRVARIAIRMILHGELAVGSLQGCGIGVALDAQSVVVVLHGFARCPHGPVSKVGLNRRPEARGGRVAEAPHSPRERESAV